MDYTLEIVEQPVNKFRFRYGYEGKSNGGIQGINSTLTNQTYPTLKITNYNGQANYRVSLVTKDSIPMQHVHELSGSTNIKVEDGDHYAIFSNISIIRQSKKVAKYIIQTQVINDYLKNFHDKAITQLDGNLKDELMLKAQTILKDLDMDRIRLKFEADILNSEGGVLRSLTPVFSHIISDIRQNEELPLKIKKLDKLNGRCTGNEEIILLCDKIKKDDIAIRFFEEDLQGNLKWEGSANFDLADIHHKYAISFKTPAYKNTNLEIPISIKIQLVRPSNLDVSNSMDFTYVPFKDDHDAIKIKRQKSENIYESKTFADSVQNKNIQQNSSEFQSRGAEGSVIKNSSSVNLDQFINKKVIQLMNQMQVALWMYVSTNNVLHLLTPFLPLISKPNEDGDNALHLPIIHGYEEVALNILRKLEKKKDIRPINKLNHLKQSPLFLALVTNQKAVFKELLNLKSDWMCLDKEFNTLFHSCIYNDNLDIFEILLDLLDTRTGHIVNRKNMEGYTPLHLATMKGNLSIVRLLINCEYADVNIIENRCGRTALHMAVELGDVAVTACLLQQCYQSINAQTYSGNTALHLAAARSNLPIVKLLISFGADATIKNYDTGSRNDDDDYDDEYDDKSDQSYCNSDDDIYNDGLQPKDFCHNNPELYSVLSHPCNLLPSNVNQIVDKIEDLKITAEIPVCGNSKIPCLIINYSNVIDDDANNSLNIDQNLSSEAKKAELVSIDSGINSILTLSSQPD